MKRNMIIAICAVVAGLPAAAEEAAPLRTWRSCKGTELEARYVRRMGSLVILKRSDGGQVRIRPSDLSRKDQEHLKELAAAEREAALKKRSERLAGMRGGSHGEAPDYLSRLEWEVVRELNLARDDPVAYAEYVRAHRKRHRGDGVFDTKRGPIQSKEGVAAVDEAIAYLEKAKSLSPLKPSKGLSLAADDHVKDTGPKGIVGHGGSDKSTAQQRCCRGGRWLKTVGENIAYGHRDAREIVIQLIVDDGVKGRGHRENIFTSVFRVVGIATGSHRKYGTMCVMDFAGGFDD